MQRRAFIFGLVAIAAPAKLKALPTAEAAVAAVDGVVQPTRLISFEALYTVIIEFDEGSGIWSVRHPITNAIIKSGNYAPKVIEGEVIHAS